MKMECTRKFKTCKGETDKTIQGKPVCSGCREMGEKFDQGIDTRIWEDEIHKTPTIKHNEEQRVI